MQILNHFCTILFEDKLTTIRETLENAVKSGAYLHGANLQGANLQDANLQDANLQDANLQGAYLRGANLQDANLQDANLQGAYLRGANLQGAYLRGAYLQGAYLQGANLQDANLQDANLQGAYLQGAYLQNVTGLYQIVPEEGCFTGFKKLSNGTIAKLLIPEDAERVGGYIGRKCRAEKAIVLDGEGFSQHNPEFEYKPGITVIPDKWDNDPRVECSNGIHFFLTRKEAESY